MIDLTIPQAFLSEVLILLDITFIYRLIVNKLVLKYIIIDCFFAVLLVCIPSDVSTVLLCLLVAYLWLADRISLHPNLIVDNIISFLCVIVLSTIFDLINVLVYIPVKHLNITVFGWLFLVVDTAVTAIVALIIVLPRIQQSFQWFRRSFQNSIQLWRVAFVYFLSYIVLTTIAEQERVAAKYSVLLLTVYFSMLLTGGAFFLDFVHSYQKNTQQDKAIKKYKAEIKEAERINEQYETIRRERHDMKNLLLSVQGYIRDKDFENANKMISSMLKTKLLNKSYDGIDQALLKLKISSINNLIRGKAYQIIEHNIPFSVEINAKITDLPGSEITTARIIGILLDNALEATIKQANPYIQFALLKHGEKSYEIVVSNSVDHIFDINKAVKLGKTSKAGHQGIGLSNVTELVNDDNHYSFSAEIKGKRVIMTCFIQEDAD